MNTPHTYRGWRIDTDYSAPDPRAYWSATHEDYDGDGDDRHLRASCLQDLMLEIDCFEDERESVA